MAFDFNVGVWGWLILIVGALVLGIIVLVNIISINLFFRLDLTSNNIYTLSPASKSIVGNLNDKLVIKAYFTDNLPSPYNNTRRYLQEILDDYRNYSHGDLEYEIISPSDEAKLEEDALKKRCLHENIKDVIFAGFVDYEQLPGYFGLSGLFVLPSREEVWGLVINEAMACGLPVITTVKVGASADLVRDGVNGFVVRDGEPHELYNAMRKIVADSGLRQKMADSSGQMIRNFGAEHTARGVKEAILCAVSPV